MSNETKSPERLTQAIFSVCVDESRGPLPRPHCRPMCPGAQFAGEFRDYATVDKRPHFAAALKNAASCVALIDFDRDPEMALETAERLRQIFLKKINIVGIGAKMDAGILLRAVRNGCSEFLTKPVDAEELAAALRRFASGVTADHRAQGSCLGASLRSPGPRAGSGTTMLAVHLATAPGTAARQEDTADRPQAATGACGAVSRPQRKPNITSMSCCATQTDLTPNCSTASSCAIAAAWMSFASPRGLKRSGGIQTDEHFGPVMDFLRREYDYILLDSAMALHSSKSPMRRPIRRDLYRLYAGHPPRCAIWPA